MPDQKQPPQPSRIERLASRARWVLAVERLWPPAVLALAILALFVTLSWLGLWIAVPRVVRILGVAGFAFALAAAALAGLRAGRPSRAEALARLDRDSGQPHRPVSTLEDQLANASDDPTTRALWELHRKRLDTTVASIKVAPPSPRMVDRDPYALRYLALMALVAAGFAVGDGKDGSIAAAFDWRGGTAANAPGFRVDAWVDPPAYTGKPPVVLFAPDQASHAPATLTAPAHSIVVVRSAGEGSVEVKTEGALQPAETPAAAASPAPADRDRADERRPAATATKPDNHEKRFQLVGNGRLSIAHDGTPLGSIALQAIPDQPPTIALIGRPKSTARGGLSLAYKIDDDYGVIGADAGFTDPVPAGLPLVRSLVPPPHLSLGMPPGPGGLGTGQTTADLSDHPWAGAEVTLVLSARDEGGNVGLSKPVRMRLPTRPFANPLARALVEQRQALDFDPDHRERVEIALDALMIEPDRFGTSNSVYLGLYTARQRLVSARTDQDLIDLSDFLWKMALSIEDGNSSQAERDLRAAAQALRDAMQNNASPQDVQRLTQALRQQMEKFLAEMARRNQQAQNEQPGGKTRVVTPQELQQMMQHMEEAARNGDMAEAQRMLDQLQNILENLKTARNGQGNPSDRAMNQQMNALDQMTRDQQALRNKTFKHGQQARRGAQPQGDASPDSQAQPQAGQDDDPEDQGDQADQDPGNDPSANGQPQQMSPDEQDLQNQQQALRQRLEDLQKGLRDLGMQGEKGLDDAQNAMKDAEGAMSQGQSGNRAAVEAQGRALEGLQKGANGIARQMAQGKGPGQGGQPGDGQDGAGGQTGQGMANGDGTDPLGRPRDGQSAAETRGSAIGEGVAARAQRVLQELRRRLGDPNRTLEEQDYLERLLKRY